jgi:hypothetical protein
MDPTLQVALSISVPTLAVLVGILINNSRLSDLRAETLRRHEGHVAFRVASGRGSSRRPV